jgi:peroxiredoxin
MAPDVSQPSTAHPLARAIQTAIGLDAPLAERLAIIADAIEQFSPDQAAIIGRLLARLKNHQAGGSAPAVGDRLPGFVLPDENGKTVRLGELLQNGPLVVTFLRGHWCPYCRVSAIGIAAAQEEIASLGGRLVAILPELPEFSSKLKSAADATFPFLTDAANGYALSLNLAIWVGLEMERMFAEAGIDLPRYHGNSAWFLPIPATFVLSRDGIIVARHVDPDHRRRMEIGDMLEAIRQAR